MTEGWFHTQGLTNNGIYGKARQRDDASIVPYKLFAAFIIIGKVSPRRDEGIPPYRDKIPFGVYTKFNCFIIWLSTFSLVKKF